jgi:hypothetical protein
MTSGGCGNVVKRGGNGDATVDFLLSTVRDKVSTLNNGFPSSMTLQQ